MHQTDFPAVAQAMLDRGYDEETVRKIVGHNWLCVFRHVWAG
jgi:microsomal dipeptidase-like Zn-dependent dipeptidase